MAIPTCTPHQREQHARSLHLARAMSAFFPPDTTRRVHRAQRRPSFRGTTPTRRRVCQLLRRLPQRPTPIHREPQRWSVLRAATSKQVPALPAATDEARALAQSVRPRAQAAADLQVGQCATLRTPPVCSQSACVEHSAGGRPSSVARPRLGTGASDRCPSVARPIALAPPTQPTVQPTTTLPTAATLPLLPQATSGRVHPARQPNRLLGDRAVVLALANRPLLARASTRGRGNRIAYRDL